MASPIVVGTAAMVAVPINVNRGIVRFQNTSATQIIYIKKIPLSGSYGVVSATDYEVRLLPDDAVSTGDYFETNSIASFMAISSAAAGSLSIYETSKV